MRLFGFKWKSFVSYDYIIKLVNLLGVKMIPGGEYNDTETEIEIVRTHCEDERRQRYKESSIR